MDYFNIHYTNNYTIGKYTISQFCLSSYPCIHLVINNDTGDSYQMRGDKIFCMLRDDKLSHTHFDVYSEDVRKRDNPTMKNITNKKKQLTTKQQ